MRALLISWEYPPVIEGGLARAVRKLSEHLVADGVEVHVLTRGGGRLPRQEERHGVIVHRVVEPQFPMDVSAFVRWVDAMNADMTELGVELADRYGFDIVHSHDWLVAGAAEDIARHAGAPWVVTVHATEFGRHQGWVHKHPQSHIHAAERTMVRRADRVITCSRYMRSHVCTVFGVPTSHVEVIQNGIDPATSSRSPMILTASGPATHSPTNCSSCSSAGSSTRRASTSRSTRSRRSPSGSATSGSSSPARAPPRPSSRSRPAASA